MIYIPLWSYSNDIKMCKIDDKKLFTFHYGPIQILRLSIEPWSSAKFTFHYGPIQMMTSKQKEFIETVFTFHYGPIQIAKMAIALSYHEIYIPLWSYSNMIFESI